MDSVDGILEDCRRALDSVDPGAREELVGGILGSRKVFIYGSGRSGLVGQMFAVRLVQLGLDVHFVGEMTTPIIGEEDLTILISNTGKTSSVVQTAKIARRIGSRVVCVTGVEDCPLAGTSDVVISMTVPDGDDVKKVAPLGTIFEDSSLLLFDGIVSEIMERRRITEEEMRNRHAIWVRSLGHQGGGHQAPVRFHPVDGEFPDFGVDDHQNAGSAVSPELLGHRVRRLGPLCGEKHPDVEPAGAGDDAEPTLLIGLDHSGQPAARPLLRSIQYGGHGPRLEQNIGARPHPPGHLASLRRRPTHTPYFKDWGLVRTDPGAPL